MKEEKKFSVEEALKKGCQFRVFSSPEEGIGVRIYTDDNTTGRAITSESIEKVFNTISVLCGADETIISKDKLPNLNALIRSKEFILLIKSGCDQRGVTGSITTEYINSELGTIKIVDLVETPTLAGFLSATEATIPFIDLSKDNIKGKIRDKQVEIKAKKRSA